MADADLEELRKARLAQLQAQGGNSSGGGEGSEEQRKQQEAEARASILSQILEPDAADRLGRIRMVKESRATEVENRLMILARSGQLRSRVSEKQLKEILEALTENEQKGGGSGNGGSIVINRRRDDWDEDDDLLDL